MKFTLAWLKDHLETDQPLAVLTERLSMLGLEVEGVEDRAAKLRPFTVGYVKEARPHPDADRLRVCLVETGQGEVQVVCGAPNAKRGMYGVFAPAGSYIPGSKLHLKPGVIRGVESNGMLLSERELGLSDEHEGIVELDPADYGPDALSVGRAFAELAGLDDPVIEVAVTPNRGDCLGVRGIARDLAAAGLGRLKPLHAPKVEGSYDSPLAWERDLPPGREEACPYVAGRSFRGVANGASPAWMQRRLLAIGLRPISALVDITNYVTYDLGRPLHVFDADRLRGNPTMRFARAGEEILALDGRSYRLDGETLIIADAAGPQGIAGIMGGEASGCTPETRSVFLEVALFDPILVALTGRRLGIQSDARYRFERGLDPESARWGVEVAARLILEICGGETSAPVAAGNLPESRRTVVLRDGRVAELGGVEVEQARQQESLERLGFTALERCRVTVGGRESEATRYRVPSWRPDIEGEACLVEEVLRIAGYDRLPMTPLTLDSSLPLPALSLKQRRVSAARTALAWSGLEEAVTFSFISTRAAVAFGGQSDSLKLENPISSDLDVLRPSVLPTLLEAAARNAARGFADLGLFEVGPQYQGLREEGQSQVAAALRAGMAGPRHWAAAPRPVDLFDAKSDALRVLEAAGAPVENLQTTADAPAWYHPGRSGTLRLGPTALAFFGELDPRVVAAFEAKGPVVAAEVFLDRLPEPKGKPGRLKPALTLSPFMPLVRDFAFVMAEEVPAEKAIRAARGADRALIVKVELFDLYRGQGLAPGEKSLALAVTLQPTTHTLTEPELEALSRKIVTQVEKATGGKLRG